MADEVPVRYSTRILKCNCENPQQDRIYGRGRPLHNPMLSRNAGFRGYRCTVCFKETAIDRKPIPHKPRKEPEGKVEKKERGGGMKVIGHRRDR